MGKKICITVFGCEPDEAAIFNKLSDQFDVSVSLVKEAVSESNAKLAAESRCVSVSHKMKLSRAILLALRDAGVQYICTRSIGLNHIDIQAAEEAGIAIGTVKYSPGSVADYSIMLMLMLMRGTKSIIHKAERQNYCLNDFRGKELRDMTVGVLGTGYIGQAVIDRLNGFGCKVLAYDHNQKAEVSYVPFPELIRSSDIITLHVPLTKDTFHMISREQFGILFMLGLQNPAVGRFANVLA